MRIVKEKAKGSKDGEIEIELEVVEAKPNAASKVIVIIQNGTDVTMAEMPVMWEEN